MSKQLPPPTTVTLKAKKKPARLGNSKKKNGARSRAPTLPVEPCYVPSFALTSPTPSLRWRPKPSIKNCFHDITEAGPSGTTNEFDTAATAEISAHRYDRLKASLHSTILPALDAKAGKGAVKKHHKSTMQSSKSMPTKPTKHAAGHSTHEGSAPIPPTPSKRRFWVPTPAEMARIGDKIPKAFVTTSVTGRKTVAIPTDTRTWFRGNLTPIESSKSVTENQLRLVRGPQSLTKKEKKKNQETPPPTPPPGISGKKPAKSVKKDPTMHAGKTLAKPCKTHSPSKIAPASNLKKTKENANKASEDTTQTCNIKELYPQPLQLNTIFEHNKKTPRVLNTRESGSTHSLPSLPPPFTHVPPNEHAELKPEKKITETVSLGFSAFVECFYCHVRYPLDVLKTHQTECGLEYMKRRSLKTKSPLDIVNDCFENSFHKLNFDGSSCCLMRQKSKPLFIEEGGKLSNLPCKISSNEALNKTCWYCGWEYSPEIIERHMVDCAAVRGNVRPTAEGKKLRRLVVKKIKTYAKLNPKKKNLWC